MHRSLPATILLSLFAASALAQDSVSKGGRLPGDAVRPWDAAAAATSGSSRPSSCSKSTRSAGLKLTTQ